MIVGIGKGVTGARNHRMRVKDCVYIIFRVISLFSLNLALNRCGVFSLLPYYQRVNETIFFLPIGLFQSFCLSLVRHFSISQYWLTRKNFVDSILIFNLQFMFLYDKVKILLDLMLSQQRDNQFHYLMQKKKKVSYHVNATLLYQKKISFVLISNNIFIKKQKQNSTAQKIIYIYSFPTQKSFIFLIFKFCTHFFNL